MRTRTVPFFWPGQVRRVVNQRSSPAHKVGSEPHSTPERRLRPRDGLTEPVYFIGPILHHPYPFIPIFTARIGSSNSIALDMSELAFDGIGMKLAALVWKRRCQRPVNASRRWSLRSMGTRR